MPTPSIQTLRADAQQVLNLDSISAVRSVVAATLANANAGTPLNPNLTTQQLWNEFYQIVTQPKSDIESIIANQLMKFLFAPPAPGGAGADKQVIFNDGGVLAGDPQFLWNKTTNLLTVTGSATITGDLTVDTNVLKVDTSLNRVGVLTASPAQALDVASGNLQVRTGGIIYSDSFSNYGAALQINAAGSLPLRLQIGGSNAYEITSGNIHTWSNVGGVAGTAMTLNSTGLGVGIVPSSFGRFSVQGTAGGAGILGMNTDATQCDIQSYNKPLALNRAGNNIAMCEGGGNVGIGVTPSAWGGSYKALQLQSVARNIAATGAGSGDFTVAFNAIYDSTDSRWEYAGTGDKAGRYSQTGSGNHRWFVSNTAGTAGNEITDFASPAMTLDASGNLLVTKTSYGLSVGFAAASTGAIDSVMASAVSAQSTLNVYSTGAGAYRFYVGMNGTINATNTTISAISDARLKENVQDIDVGLGAILALKPRKFDWKAGKGKDIKGDRGFIAQEFEQVFPNLIDEWKDPAPEGEAPYKSVRQDLIPVLVKAIQELAAEVNALKNA